MADMHRPGRIGRDIFDVHRHAAAKVAAAVIGPKPHGAAQGVDPGTGFQRQIDKARPRYVGAGDKGVGAKFRRDRLGKLARLLAGILGQHHRRIGGDIAVSWIAWRLDRDARLIDAGRQCARAHQLIGRVANAREKLGENVFCNDEAAMSAPRA